MNIEHLNNRNWYLAQYNTAGKNRESLFSWLNEQNVVPWTPLITRKIRRADSRCCYRERIFAIFPGYFFILANFDIQPVSALRRHSAFIDFVKFGGEIKPVNKDIVDGLMKIYPDPVLNPGAREELNAASSIWLTKAQYQYLLRMENTLYMSKKTAGGRNTARYLGRYLKKPPIAASRLAHYNGGASLSFRYLDHKTGETATETLTQRELVARLKQHIPEKFFKMVRYFGFLANRVCGEKLPQVYRALGMDKPEPVAKVCYAQMVKQFLSRDPFECVLCGCRMVYRRAIAGLNVSGLKKNARDISLLRYMPA